MKVFAQYEKGSLINYVMFDNVTTKSVSERATKGRNPYRKSLVFVTSFLTEP